MVLQKTHPPTHTQGRLRQVRVCSPVWDNPSKTLCDPRTMESARQKTSRCECTYIHACTHTLLDIHGLKRRGLRWTPPGRRRSASCAGENRILRAWGLGSSQRFRPALTRLRRTSWCCWVGPGSSGVWTRCGSSSGRACTASPGSRPHPADTQAHARSHARCSRAWRCSGWWSRECFWTRMILADWNHVCEPTCVSRVAGQQKDQAWSCKPSPLWWICTLHRALKPCPQYLEPWSDRWRWKWPGKGRQLTTA